MDESIEAFWALRLEKCRKALAANNFGAYLANDPGHAKRIVLDDILPDVAPLTASWGDSMTLHATGVLEAVKQDPAIAVIETFAENVPRAELIERRRQALLTDLFFTGSNAVTEAGQLVNLDMIGNRTGAITFGPRNVVILAGRNKIVPHVPAAMQRIKACAAPANAVRHAGWKTPCRQTGYCMDCQSPDRICNSWTITEKSFPQGRIRVVLINADLGL
jgi:hypothetical protein